jgi:hypothetical protein
MKEADFDKYGRWSHEGNEQLKQNIFVISKGRGKMNEIQLIEKLKEYEYTQNKIIYSIKECINSINERLTLVYGEGFNIVDNNTPFTQNFNSPFNQYFPPSRIYWNYVGDKIIFFYYNGDSITYSIKNEGSDIYLGYPPLMNKIINADSAIIAEYIKFI